MAKSKNGGTRSMIRGRVGSDVYSVGKDGQGKRQQVVRSLAESVANPRTESQMFGRMIMSTVMQAVSAMAFIIDHSFDGVGKGQPSISEFIRLNYARVKADALAHPSSGNKFGLAKYQQKGMHQGSYILSKGSAQYPSAVTPAAGSTALKIDMGSGTKYSDLQAAFGLTAEEYVTLISFNEVTGADGGKTVTPLYARLSINPDAAAATVVTEQNALGAFNIESNYALSATLTDGKVTINFDNDESTLYGIAVSIVTRKENGAFIHSTAEWITSGTPEFAADVALATYPTGTEAFLNGGEI